MQKAIVNTGVCTGHDACPARKSCPTKAIVQIDPGEMAVINSSSCRGCGDCISACPMGAIDIRQT
ncbi:MAG: 4Fe-4S binding protein [Thermoleophilia bacterium]